jgi:uncharacterized protein (TIGR02597 family)
MKQKITYSILAAAAACGMALGQTAYTTPVGYMTVPIPGTNSEVPSKLQLANQGLLPNGPAAAGGGASVSFDGTTLTDTDGTFTPSAFVNGTANSHVLEITSDGPVKGALSWINANTATTITTNDNLSSAGDGASYRVWKAYTMATLFGNPPASSVLGGGESATTADSVQILDPISNTYTNFFFKNAGKGGTGWQSSDVAITSPANYAIHPNDGMVILRKQATDGELVISGSVKTGATMVRVEGNGTSTILNILANQIPVDQLTLGASGLYTGNATTGLKGGESATTADNLLIFNADTNEYTTFYYKNSGKGGTGWISSDPAILTPATYPLPSTGALLIQRKAGNAFNWTVPTVIVGE